MHLIPPLFSTAMSEVLFFESLHIVRTHLSDYLSTSRHLDLGISASRHLDLDILAYRISISASRFWHLNFSISTSWHTNFSIFASRFWYSATHFRIFFNNGQIRSFGYQIHLQKLFCIEISVSIICIMKRPLGSH